MPPDRLSTARNVWVASVRPDGRPHLVPVWFVVIGERWYFVTAPDSVKARNLRQNPKVALSLEDGNHPTIVEGEAHPVQPSDEVIRAFQAKYDWNIAEDQTYTQTFEVSVARRVMG